MRRGPLALVCIVAVLFGVGCKKKGPDTFVYSVFLEEWPTKADNLEVDGTPLVLKNQYPNGKSYTLTLPAAQHLVEKKASAVFVTTCGPTKLEGKITVGLTKADSISSEDYERKNLDKGKNDLTATFVASAPVRFADVYVDPDGAFAPVTVGTMTLEAKPTSTRVPLGTCPTGDEVKVGGVVVGKLVVTPRKSLDRPDQPGTAFVDAKGGHCYEKKTHMYQEKSSTIALSGTEPERIQGQRLYAFDIDDFLTPSPESVTSKQDFPTRVEVRRCPVVPPPPAKGAATPKPKKK